MSTAAHQSHYNHEISISKTRGRDKILSVSIILCNVPEKFLCGYDIYNHTCYAVNPCNAEVFVGSFPSLEAGTYDTISSFK